jgi:hypothetical protein
MRRFNFIIGAKFFFVRVYREREGKQNTEKRETTLKLTVSPSPSSTFEWRRGAHHLFDGAAGRDQSASHGEWG